MYYIKTRVTQASEEVVLEGGVERDEGLTEGGS